MDTLLPTTKHRRGRRTARQERALASPGTALMDATDLGNDLLLTGSEHIILDIGFGSGDAVVALAQADPDSVIIGVDMHTPGIGDLLASIHELSIANVRIIDGDVRLVLASIPPARLTGVRTFFPDPWPKKRHHRRRLVTGDLAADLAERVRPGGFWHLATDWPDYAHVMDDTISSCPLWTGGVIPRPDWRPETRYERRGRAAGRESIDLWFTRVES